MSANTIEKAIRVYSRYFAMKLGNIPVDLDGEPYYLAQRQNQTISTTIVAAIRPTQSRMSLRFIY